MTRAKKLPKDCLPQCATCSFFVGKQNEDIGVCRRLPPVMLVVNDVIERAATIVSKEEWCGEFQRFSN